MKETEIKVAIEFIKNTLKIFINEFPQTRVRYEYDADAEVHTVEVVPNEVYHLNEQYIDWENTFTSAFISQFPDQNIGFISDDALVGLDSVDFELKGKDYSCEINDPIVTISVNQFNIGYISTSQEIFNNGQVISVNFDAIVALENVNALPTAIGILNYDQLANPYYSKAA